ncbi:MAG: phospho-sugar mutase [Spirochaetes bacterium]|uniref:Phospho-sugar mutase n=1 Tax=Candidatus Gallitreponema excrementavium TaxID=2840840 RepID=A0A9D9N2Y1_9SPIR|nr:phospho-sugar mutase [Candidatus Gallitreponema excrementavium]
MDNEEIISRAKKYIQDEKIPFFREEVEKLLAENNMKELEDRFYRDLEFGTGGLRGIIGGGTNRMNPYVINQATQGLANYVMKALPQKASKGELKAVIAYDSRNFSDTFAEAAALIFAANGFKTYLFSSLRPTPELSFAVRELECDTGVVVTASHNPPQYNGYKAYWSDGAQVIEPHDKGIISEVESVTEVKTISREDAISKGLLVIIDSLIDEPYWKMVKSKLFRPDLIKKMAPQVKVVYTPLHGTGAMHVEKVLGDLGLTVITVPEQRAPDGNFPTVSYPNPEEAAALKLALELGAKEKADVVMATDPDSDRFGSAVPDKNGNYVLISGNQMGALLTDYICLTRKELNLMPENPAIIRSIVSTTLADKIAASYGVTTEECLTGFKWIAAVMADFEKTGRNNYIFGFEESYGYNIETEVRDKDGVSAAALCAEMTLYWKSKGKSLLDRLEEIFAGFGYYQDSAFSISFPGSSGNEKMKAIMAEFRNNEPASLGGFKVSKIRDIQEQIVFSLDSKDKKAPTNLPKSNVLQFYLENETRISVRPSGTEPKIKFYFCCQAPSKEEADKIISSIEKDIREKLEKI